MTNQGTKAPCRCSKLTIKLLHCITDNNYCNDLLKIYSMTDDI